MAVTQALTVTEVSGSPNTATNQSKVRIRWTSTQSGESWNGYEKTAYYYVSINGGAETKYSLIYTLPKGVTVTILDTVIVVPHKDDGSGKVTVRTWMDTGISAGVVEKSQTIALTTIARASEITQVSSVILGNKCSVKWTPKSAAFRYKLKFSFGGWSYTTAAIHPNTTSAYTYTGYTIPMDVANQIIANHTGDMSVTLYTYSDSGATTQVGATDSATFKVTVPDNSNTKPAVEMSLSPVGNLNEAFAGLYIQGHTKVKANITGTGKYNADIVERSINVAGISYSGGPEITTGYLTNYGNFPATGYVTDSRGFVGSTTKAISVIPYSRPSLTVDVCGRCDKDGNLSDSGTYLKIKASRSFSSVKSGGQEKNICWVHYRYKRASEPNFSEWYNILSTETSSSDTVETGALLEGALDVDTSYVVQVIACDLVDTYTIITTNIPTDQVHTHRTEKGIGFGKYCEGENLLDVGWDAHFHGEVTIGDGDNSMTLREYILSVINGG